MTPLQHFTGIPDHELLRRIGSGSYGEVWLARSALGAYRAVKIVYRKSFEDSRPFEREFNGIQKFEPFSRSHEGLVDILQAGRHEDYFYYVMELADDAARNAGVLECWSGAQQASAQPSTTPALQDPNSYTARTLRHDLKQRGRLPVDDCIQIGLFLASALDHLHKHALVHRDIKPSNIIFVDGEPKLADIGLVTDAGDSQSIVGTEGYLPPEGPGAAQADIFSLGKVLYEISTGQDRRQFPDLPPNLKEWPDQAAVLELNEVLLRACARDARLRYQSAAEMHDELGLLQRGQSVKAQRDRAARWAIAKKGALALTLLTVLVAGASISLREFKRSRSGRGFDPSADLGRLVEGPPSTNSEANVLYHHAMGIMRADDYQKLGEAYTNFFEATRLDPNFAKPYAALFEMHVRERFVGMPASTPDQLRRLSAKLVELAPSLSATHVARACVQYMDWEFDEAKKSWEKAIRLNPNNEFARTSYGFALTRWGDSSYALKQLSMARELASSKGVIQAILGDPYYLLRDYTNALAQYNKGLRFTPDNSTGHRRIGRVFQAMHQYLKAIDEFEKEALIDGADEAKTKESFDQLRDAFNKNGDEGYWQEQLRRTETKPDSEFYWKAVIHVHLGHTNDVFRWLYKSSETREEQADGLHHYLNGLLLDEYWDSLHSDPRFKKLVREIGFPGN